MTSEAPSSASSAMPSEEELLAISREAGSSATAAQRETDRFTAPAIAEFEAELTPDERRRVHQKVRELSVLRPWRSVAIVLFDWLIIAAVIGATLRWWSWPLYLVSVFVIAARQHALLLITHDAAHYRVSTNRRWNDFVGNALCAWPTFLVTTESYRANHIQHHRYTNADKDPDWMRKVDKAEWKYPRSFASVAWMYVWQGIGGGVLDMIDMVRSVKKANKSKAATQENVPAAPKSPWRTVFSLALFVIVFATGNGWNFLLFWMVPLLTALPVILRNRSVAEHFGLPYDHELRQTRTVLAGPVERFFLAPHNGNYHLEHHCYPSVPWYRLPELRSFLRTFPAYSQNAYENTSYLAPSPRSFLSDIVRREAKAT